jgi:nucleoside-diphosphate-sugar epimerase
MKQILITGINGFFGRNLVDRWMKMHTLVGIDLPASRPSSASVFDKEWHNQINFCDLREDIDHVKFMFLEFDAIIHCAAKTRIDPSWKDFKDYYNTNISASHELFKAAQEQNVKKFIYFSSSSVYGNNGQEVQSEDGPLRPTNPYAVSKLAAEAALTAQALKGSTELIIVRPFTMYGEHMNFGKHSLAIAKFIKAAARNEPLLLEAGGDQSRDFVHADDAIDALALILEHGKNGDIYNIGTGNSITIKQLADVVSKHKVVAPARIGHIDNTCADISKLTALGYKPKHNVIDWLTKTVKEFKLN